MRVGQSGNNNQVQSAETSAPKKVGKAQAAKEGGESAAKGSTSSIAGDDASVSLSTRSKDFAKAKEVAAQTPDTREEKIAELKRRIASGSYSVDANAVADKMVDEHLHSAAIG